MGQKQLLCLSRALLRESRLVLLDEATSNVDTATDRLIQQILRSKFRNATVMTIAHRLLTIADYDKVVVMDAGTIRESGPPFELYQQKGLFFDLVECIGSGSQEVIDLAKVSYDKKYHNSD